MSMLDRSRMVALAVVLTLASQSVTAQEAVKTPPAPAPVTAAPTGNAALVNDQPISEASVQRALRGAPAGDRAKARQDILDFLIDNLLIDQYLISQKVAVDPKDVELRIKQLKDEIQKKGITVDKFLAQEWLTEDDLKREIAAFLRMDRFVEAQANDAALRDLYAKSPDVFNGSEVRARHILLTPPGNDPKAHEAARAELTTLKQQLEAHVAAELAKLPATADAATREKERARILEEDFTAAAKAKSQCPSKAQGGDLNYFPRAGAMVEPFAATAFAMKTYEISDVVPTRFGYHLILTTGRKPGKEVKFEDIKDFVKELYAEQLRDKLLGQLRQSAKIAIVPSALKQQGN